MPIANDVQMGRGVTIHHPELVNLYGCRIGEDTRIGAFVEIQKGAIVGARCKISSHTFICEGVTLEDEVFVGHGVMFINDRHPRAAVAGRPKGEADWALSPVRVRGGASIGSGAVILAGVTIGRKALIGAGAVVTRDVPDDAVVIAASGATVLHLGVRGLGSAPALRLGGQFDPALGPSLSRTSLFRWATLEDWRLLGAFATEAGHRGRP